MNGQERILAIQPIVSPTVSILPEIQQVSTVSIPKPITNSITPVPLPYDPYKVVKPNISSTPLPKPTVMSASVVTPPEPSGKRYETKIFPTSLYAGSYEKPMFVPNPLSTITVGTLTANQIYTNNLNASTLSTSLLVLDDQSLQATANTLLLNGTPIGSIANVSSLAEWSVFPSISTLQMDGNDIVDVKTITATTGAFQTLTTNTLNGANVNALLSTVSGNDVSQWAKYSAVSTLQLNNNPIASSNITLNATDNLNLNAQDVTVMADEGVNPNVASVGITAKGGIGGNITLTADVGAGGTSFGAINLVANGGTTAGVGTGGSINITANTPLGTACNASSKVSVSASGVNVYAGAVPPVGSLTGYLFEYGSLGINQCVGLPSVIPNVPGTLYQYAPGGLGVGGIRLESPSGVELIDNTDLYAYRIYPYFNPFFVGTLSNLLISGRTHAVQNTQYLDLELVKNLKFGDNATEGVITGLSTINGLPVSALTQNLTGGSNISVIGNAINLNNAISLSSITVSSLNGLIPGSGGSGGIQSLVGGNQINIANASTINLNPNVYISSLSATFFNPSTISSIIIPGYSNVFVPGATSTVLWPGSGQYAFKQNINSNDQGTYRVWTAVSSFIYSTLAFNADAPFLFDPAIPGNFARFEIWTGSFWGPYTIAGVANIGGNYYIDNSPYPDAIDNLYYGGVSTISTLYTPSNFQQAVLTPSSLTVSTLFISSINGVSFTGSGGGLPDAGNGLNYTNTSTLNVNANLALSTLSAIDITSPSDLTLQANRVFLRGANNFSRVAVTSTLSLFSASNVDVRGNGINLVADSSVFINAPITNMTGTTTNMRDITVSSINGQSYPPPGTSVVSTFQNILLTPSTNIQSATGFSELQVLNPTSLSTGQVLANSVRVGSFATDPNSGFFTRDTSNRAVFVDSNATVNRLAYTNDPVLTVSSLTASQFVSSSVFNVSTIINNNFVNNTTTTNDAFFSTIKFRNGAGTAQISQPSTVGANSQPAGRFLFNQDLDAGTNEIWARRVRIGIQNPPANNANELIFYDSIGGRQIGLQTANIDRTLRINDSINPGFANPGYLLDSRLNPVICSSIVGNPITNTALQCLFPSTTQNTIGISTLSLFPAPLPLTQFGSANFSNAPSTFTLTRPYRDTSYVVQLTPQADTSGQVAHATVLSPSTFTAHAGSGSVGTGFFWTTIGNNY